MIKASAFAVALLGFGSAFADGSAKRGKIISETHCARCHIVGSYNKFGGIGSTPSFNLLVGMSDGIERFSTFYERRPHPAFVFVPDVPRWTKLPPYAAPFKVTPENIEDILAFARTLKPKDLQGVSIGKIHRQGANRSSRR